MTKDQILYAMRYANEIEYSGFYMFSHIMFALFKDDPTKHIVNERELKLNRSDLERVLDTLYGLLRLKVGEKTEIGGVEFIITYGDDDRIYRLIKDFKTVLEEHPDCDDFMFTNY